MSADPRSSTNPLFNDNRLKLGVFAFNGACGAFTHVPEQSRPSWEGNRKIAAMADQSGFEILLPYVRYRALTTANHSSGNVLDPISWAGALAATTSYSAIFSTVNVHHVHPLVMAKAAATIDQISGGRFGINITCGWFEEELRMFGLNNTTHDGRYDYADEWIQIIRRLWSEEDFFDYHGRYFELEGCISNPKPIQKPSPALMNAGGSPRGQRYVTENCDMAFIGTGSLDWQNLQFDKLRANTEGYRAFARDTAKREPQVWMACGCVQRDSRQAALDYVEYYSEAQGDFEPAKRWPSVQGAVEGGAPAHVIEALEKSARVGLAAPLLIGSGAEIAEQLTRISAAGVDGVVLTFVDYEDGLGHFIADVVPRLEQAGLRQPFGPDRLTAPYRT